MPRKTKIKTVGFWRLFKKLSKIRELFFTLISLRKNINRFWGILSKDVDFMRDIKKLDELIRDITE